MNPVYQKELDFAIAVFERMRLQVHILHPRETLALLDAGMRSALGISVEYETPYRTAFRWTNQRAIYKILDRFMCHYLFFHLPDMAEPAAAVIGPYLTIDPTKEMLMEQSEKLGIPQKLLPQITDYYAAIPVFHDPSSIMAVVTSLGASLWQDERSFDIVDVNYEQTLGLPDRHTADAPIEQTDILMHMKQLEERYAFENQLMEIVSKGLTNRAEVMMSSVSQLNYQSRLADPLRNMKNYCIISNTLLRKAAQQGGVHPLYLDELSGQFARQIETAPTLDAANALVGKMIRAYCRLVRTHKGSNYSSVIQKVITYIDANLSGDLSLPSVAGQIKISQGYLSALFHRETGHTLAAYITAQRMKAALKLLQSSRLQIQTVAQLSGFSDPNYFGKLFKRHYGITPLQYRKDHFAPSSQKEG